MISRPTTLSDLNVQYSIKNVKAYEEKHPIQREKQNKTNRQQKLSLEKTQWQIY